MTIPLAYNIVYSQYAKDYGNFSTIVLDSLKPLESKCDLALPRDAQKIYCADVNDRVQVNGGAVIFTYEVKHQPPMYGGGMREDTRIDVEEIGKLLTGNLQHNLRGGYYFQGSIDVWDIGNNRIRIEVHGVNREFPNPKGRYYI